MGLIAGGISGGLAFRDPCESEPAVCAGFLHETRQSATISGAFSGGVLGAVGGAVAGVLWPGERWSRLPLALHGAQVRLSPSGDHGKGLKSALKFGAR